MMWKDILKPSAIISGTSRTNWSNISFLDETGRKYKKKEKTGTTRIIFLLYFYVNAMYFAAVFEIVFYWIEAFPHST